MTDSEILELIRCSPPKGHRALFDEYYTYVYAISINILRGYGSAEDVEECVIDVFASAIKKLSEDHTGTIKPFIGTVAKHRAISIRRSLVSKTGNNVPLDSDEFVPLESGERVEENAEHSAMTDLLLQKIKDLGEPDSTIIIQKYFYERNAKEISRMIGMNHAAVRMRCTRAIKKLRSLLRDFY
ncbi:MAG: sigma-70 family RNA polymerase sigma factor [Ruminococcus sp.]|nr:sigma-70 family RNA polymerase sigma factor [Ruminococcus sp.]